MHAFGLQRGWAALGFSEAGGMSASRVWVTVCAWTWDICQRLRDRGLLRAGAELGLG